MNNFWKDKRVFITGHEGFLGSNLAIALLDSGACVVGVDKVDSRPISVLKGERHRIKCYKTDITDLKKLKNIVSREKPEIVFHLAAEAIVGRAKKDPLNVFKTNIQGTWNLMEALRSYAKAQAIIVASSDKAYGSSKALPYTEQTPLSGRHPYDASKSCEDIIAQSYYHSYGLPVGILRCGNIYGPGDFNFSRIVPDAIRSILGSNRFVIRSDGKYTRDYVFVDDIVNAYTLFAENMKKKKLAGMAFNISCEKPVSVSSLFNSICSASGVAAGKPVILNKAKDEIRHQYLSAEKAKKLLGWKSKHSLEMGLQITLGWYRGVL